MIELKLTNITDKPTRDALEAIRDTYNASDLNLGPFKFFSLTIPDAVTNLEVFHNLGYVPLDIIETRVTGGTVTWNYDSFTKDKLSLTTSAAVSIRFLAGRID
jgi:hypothetical protein